MPRFKQQAYYLNNRLLFVERFTYFKTLELAQADIEQFAEKIPTRIPNRSYTTKVVEVPIDYPIVKAVEDELIRRLAL